MPGKSPSSSPERARSRPGTGSALAAYGRWWRSDRFRVLDQSMAPIFLPGDHVLAERGAYRQELPRPRDVVIVRDPETDGRQILKRVERVEVERPFWESEPLRHAFSKVWLAGDNPRESRDSRAFGWVPTSRIIGRVWYRYAPRSRRGPIPSGDPPNR